MDFDDLIYFLIVSSVVLIIGLITLAIISASLPISVWHYGNADTYGYMTTYEEGMFLDSVWIRADYTSSNTDRYCVSKSSNLKATIQQHIKNKDRVELSINKYMFGACSYKVTTVTKIGDEE